MLIRQCVLVLLAGSLCSAAQPPATAKRPVTDVYHGVKVVDDYRWLEDWSDPAVRAWSDAQNRFAREYLDRIPSRQTLYDQLKKLYSEPSPSYSGLTFRHGVLFSMKRQPPKEQPFLVTLNSLDATRSERVVVDPVQIDSTGHTAIDFYVPSVDGKYVAVSMSKGGSENGDLHIYTVATAAALPDVIPRVNGGTAGGGVAWNADGSGFFYTRYPRAGERPAADLDFYQQVWFHRLGTKTESDTYSLGKDFPRIAEIALQQSEDGKYVLARMAYGDGGEFAHYLLGPQREWQQIAKLSDEVRAIEFGPDGSLYLLSHRNAPVGAILKTPLAHPDVAGAAIVVPQSGVSIESFVVTPHRIYIADMAGGPSQVRIIGPHGAGKVPIPPVSSVSQMLRYQGDDLLFENASYLDPPAWLRFTAASNKLVQTAVRETAPVNFNDTEVVRDFAVSKDGTKIPLNIIRRKGTKLDGNNPTLLYGYGGYGISMRPQFLLRLRPLLDRGFVYVVANLRGGGEYGEAWHRAGMLTKKQNVFDDFAAAALYLIDHHYTTPPKLAIEGGSNGGLLMGAALTQHPELYRAVVSHVGIYDMLRVELSPNGAFNVTEFGTVKEADQFRALYAYSPYHHVKDDVRYPAVLFLTGANDPRVDPANSRKMTARLQATETKLPVLLRTSSTSGHGIGSSLSELLSQQADVDAFLFEQLGISQK